MWITKSNWKSLEDGMKRISTVVILVLIISMLAVCFFACDVKQDETKQEDTKCSVLFLVDDSVYASVKTAGNENITLPNAPTKLGYTFEGWYLDKNVWKNNFTSDTLLNKKLTSDISVYAKWNKNIEDIKELNIEFDANGNAISFTYGEYPQTIKDSSVVIDESSLDSREYYLGSDGAYYEKVTANAIAPGYTYSNGTTIISGNVEYFKVEPIKWKVLYNTDGTYLVMSDLILDAQEYYDKLYLERNGAIDYQGNSTTSIVYVNNYKYSDIRTFLNTTFINKAFTAKEQNLIQTTTVDNSVSSTGFINNSYSCEDTNDKIFLLSYIEVKNSSYGFIDDSDRYAKGSDYAKARGLCLYYTEVHDYTRQLWFLRSPTNFNSKYVRSVNFDGDANSYSGGNYFGGVRPALNINL